MENSDIILTNAEFESTMIDIDKGLLPDLPVIIHSQSMGRVNLTIISKVLGVHPIRALFHFNNGATVVYVLNLEVYKNVFDFLPIYSEDLLQKNDYKRQILLSNTGPNPINITFGAKPDSAINLRRNGREFSETKYILIRPYEQNKYITTLEYNSQKLGETLKNQFYLRYFVEGENTPQILAISYYLKFKKKRESPVVIPSFIDFGQANSNGLPHRIPIYLLMETRNEVYVHRWIYYDQNLQHFNTSPQVTETDAPGWIKKHIGYLVYHNPREGAWKGKIRLELRFYNTHRLQGTSLTSPMELQVIYIYIYIRLTT